MTVSQAKILDSHRHRAEGFLNSQGTAVWHLPQPYLGENILPILCTYPAQKRLSFPRSRLMALAGQRCAQAPHRIQYWYIPVYFLGVGSKSNVVTRLIKRPAIPRSVISPCESPKVPRPLMKAMCRSLQALENCRLSSTAATLKSGDSTGITAQ